MRSIRCLRNKRIPNFFQFKWGRFSPSFFLPLPFSSSWCMVSILDQWRGTFFSTFDGYRDARPLEVRLLERYSRALIPCLPVQNHIEKLYQNHQKLLTMFSFLTPPGSHFSTTRHSLIEYSCYCLYTDYHLCLTWRQSLSGRHRQSNKTILTH